MRPKFDDELIRRLDQSGAEWLDPRFLVAGAVTHRGDRAGNRRIINRAIDLKNDMHDTSGVGSTDHARALTIYTADLYLASIAAAVTNP